MEQENVKEIDNQTDYNPDEVFYSGTMDVGTFQYLRIVFLIAVCVCAIVFGAISVWVFVGYFGGSDYLLPWVILAPILVICSIILFVWAFKNRKGYKKVVYEIRLGGVYFTTGLFFIKKNFVKYSDMLDINVGKGILYNDMRAGNIYLTTAEKVYVMANIEEPENVKNIILQCVNAYYEVIASNEELEELEEAEQDMMEDEEMIEEQEQEHETNKEDKDGEGDEN